MSAGRPRVESERRGSGDAATGSGIRVIAVFAATLITVGTASYAYLSIVGHDAEAMAQALRLTARTALLIYLLIFVARPLVQVAGGSLARALLARRRYLGVAFAAVMTVHLVLLTRLHGFVPNLYGGGAYLLMYLMLLTSFNASAAALGPRAWRILHKIGLYWIGAVFAGTIVLALVDAPGSFPLRAEAALLVFALALRVGAYYRCRQSTAPIARAR